MKIILTSNNKQEIFVDDEDYDRLSIYSWTGEETSVRRKESAKVNTQIHIPIANQVLNTYGVVIDHINRNPYDNQKHNLRPCNWSQNSANKIKLSGFTSQYKGVSWFKQTKKWRATIQFNGRQKHLGFFISEEAAARSYDLKAFELFGEFAILNFK